MQNSDLHLENFSVLSSTKCVLFCTSRSLQVLCHESISLIIILCYSPLHVVQSIHVSAREEESQVVEHATASICRTVHSFVNSVWTTLEKDWTDKKSLRRQSSYPLGRMNFSDKKDLAHNTKIFRFYNSSRSVFVNWKRIRFNEKLGAVWSKVVTQTMQEIYDSTTPVHASQYDSVTFDFRPLSVQITTESTLTRLRRARVWVW